MTRASIGGGRRLLAIVAWLSLGVPLGCATARNYLEPQGPRFVGGQGVEPASDQALRVVTFNIEYGLHIDEALAGLRSHAELRGADLLLLQEMDADGVKRIAAELGLNYVYYPSAVHPKSRRDTGSALLSPWPIETPRKLLLPHTTRLLHLARAAVTARVRVEGRALQVYSVHLGSPFGLSPGRRRAQAEAVLKDAAACSDPVVIAGDFNSRGLGELFVGRGYAWPTRHVGATVRGFSFDHVFTRGLDATATAGVAREVKDASDHRPVWASLLLPELGESR